jgi:internalin A
MSLFVLDTEESSGLSVGITSRESCFERVLIMADGPASRPWRRYLRFSVRGLIVLVLVIGGGLGWLVRSARIQHAAVAAIERAGGGASYDFEINNGISVGRADQFKPRWLAELIGVDYLAGVTDVSLPSWSPETGAAIAHLGRLTRLKRVHLARWNPEDSELANLEGLTNISVLYLDGIGVTDDVMSQLKSLTNLEALFLEGTQVTDAGIEHLKGLTQLSQLDLNGTQVTDAGLAHLKDLTNLDALMLESTRVTDAGLVHLRGMTKLGWLNLFNSEVTDAGLVHLKGLTKLHWLQLGNTQVTNAGAEDLMQALPRLKPIPH